MSNTQSMCTSFLGQLLSAGHNFNSTNAARSANTADTFKAALYVTTATVNAATTVYSSTNEVTGTGYTAGGNVITISANPGIDTTNNVAFPYFTNVTWTGATITARGALIYNATTGNSVAILNFGNDITMNNFTITWPTATSTTAVITIS